MTDRQPPAVEKRVVITIDSNSFSDATIEYAVTVASRLQRPLHGVFIQDTDLLATAALPFSREICLSTGNPQTLDPGRLESAFAETVARFRQRLAQRAEQNAVRWTVTSVRGRRRDFQLEDVTDADYCIYDSASAPPLGRNMPPGRRFLVIDGGDAVFYQTLASLLAPLEGQDLHLTLIREAAAAADATLKASLPRGTHLHYLEPDQLADALQQAGDRFDYVVVSRQRWLKPLAPQLARLGCPLIVVG